MPAKKHTRKPLPFDSFKHRFLEDLRNRTFQSTKQQQIIRRILRDGRIADICARLMWHVVDGPGLADLSERYVRAVQGRNKRLLQKPRGRDHDWAAVEQAEKVLGTFSHAISAILINAADEAATGRPSDDPVTASQVKEGIKRLRRRFRHGARLLIEETLRERGQNSSST